MGIEAEQISESQVDALLGLQEGHFVEIKSRDVRPAQLTKTLSALANASGGDLYVGINERGRQGVRTRRWRGFKDQESANALIQVFDDVFPLGQYISMVFLESETNPGFVLKVEVLKTRRVAYASDGIPYLRRGAQNLPMKTPEQLKRLELDKGVVSFESDTVDVELEIVSNSTVLLGFLIEVIPTAEPEPWLAKQLLTLDGKPTVGAILLFGEEPQAILPKRCGIKVFRYETRDQVGTRATLSFNPVTIEGCQYDQIKTAVSKTVEIVEGISILGPSGLEEIQYPHEALHEIITNAVLHRDYSIVTDIQIRIFDNRIEVESPGRLPGYITEDNILEEQLARNGTIVRLISKFPDPPNKDVGEGLNTAFEAMRKLRLKEPIIREKENSVEVVIRHEPLASPEEAVMEWLEEHEEISNSTAREITGITSENTMKNVFYRLRKLGLIEQIPGREKGPTAAWRKK